MFDDKGVCKVGIGRKALIPIVVFDLILNVSNFDLILLEVTLKSDS